MNNNIIIFDEFQQFFNKDFRQNNPKYNIWGLKMHTP